MSEQLLRLDHITMQFGGVVAVDDLELEVNEGEIVALIGPNGAGKSTLLRCLSGIYRTDSGSVTVDGAPVRLTPIEYSILLYLVEHRGSVVPVEDLFRAVWNEDFMPGSNNTVMVHIRHLREKIGDDAQKPRFIKNVWGVGYIIE